MQKYKHKQPQQYVSSKTNTPIVIGPEKSNLAEEQNTNLDSITNIFNNL